MGKCELKNETGNRRFFSVIDGVRGMGSFMQCGVELSFGELSVTGCKAG